MKENIENNEVKAEHKLVILYILDKANCPLTNLQITKLLYDFEDFNYYYFQHLLSDLIDKKYIISFEQENENLYKISNEGKEVLTLTENMLPGILKYKLDNIAKNMLQVVQNEVSVTAEYIPESDKEYITKCKISEAHKTLFELNVYCASQEQAKTIASNWKEHADELYPEIIKMLTN